MPPRRRGVRRSTLPTVAVPGGLFKVRVHTAHSTPLFVFTFLYLLIPLLTLFVLVLTLLIPICLFLILLFFHAFFVLTYSSSHRSCPCFDLTNFFFLLVSLFLLLILPLALSVLVLT